jgi:hypothetical protein
MHNVKLRNSRFWQNIKMKAKLKSYTGQAARMEVKNSYQILGVVPEATRSLGRPRRRWENNIKQIIQKWRLQLWSGFTLRTAISWSCNSLLTFRDRMSVPSSRKKSKKWIHAVHDEAVAYPGIFSGGGGVQQIQLRTEGRENRDLGAVAP